MASCAGFRDPPRPSTQQPSHHFQWKTDLGTQTLSSELHGSCLVLLYPVEDSQPDVSQDPMKDPQISVK